MSTTPVTPNPKWYTMQGADGKWYKTQAASPEEAKSKMTAAYAPKPTATGTPQKPANIGGGAGGSWDGLAPFAAPQKGTFAPKHLLQSAKESAIGLATGVANTGADVLALGGVSPTKNPLSAAQSLYSNLIDSPAKQEGEQAAEAYKRGEYDRAALHETIGAAPMIGPWIMQAYEKSVTGDPGGAGVGFATQYGLGELFNKSVESLNPEELRKYADKNRLRIAQPKEVNQAVGEGMRASQTWGRLKTIKKQIGDAKEARNAQVEQMIAKAPPVDLQAEIDTAVKKAKERPMILGDTKAVNAIDKWHKELSNPIDPQTGKPTPRNWKAVSASDAWTMSKGIWEDLEKAGVGHAAVNFRDAIGKKLNSVAPGYSQTQMEIHGMIQAEEGIQAQLDKDYLGRAKTFMSHFANVPSLAAFLTTKYLTHDYVTAIAVSVGMRTLYDLPVSRSVRAMMQDHLADLIGGKRQPAIVRGVRKAVQQAKNPPQAPPAAPVGGTGPKPQSPPNAPVSAPSKAVTASPAPVAPTAPVVPQLGSGPAAAAAAPAPVSPKPTPTPTPVVTPDIKGMVEQGGGQYQGEMEGIHLFQSPKTKTTLGMKAADINPDAVRAHIAKSDAKFSDAKSNTKATPGNTGTAADWPSKYDYKALHSEAVDTVAKSPMHAEQLAKMKAELERAMSGKATKEEMKTINKHIYDRQRLAAKTQEAAATATKEKTASSDAGKAELVSKDIPIDRAMELRDIAYKQLATLPMGKEMVEGIKREAKSLNLSPYDELTAIAESIEFLREGAKSGKLKGEEHVP